MKTMVMNYAKTLDEMIPDATMEVVMDKCDRIHNNARDTCMCVGAAGIMAALTVKETTELTVILSKTVVKKTLIKAKELYDSADTRTIRR